MHTASDTYTVHYFWLFLSVLILTLSFILRVLLVRGESKDPADLLDSRVFQDPRVLLVRVASPESRY